MKKLILICGAIFLISSIQAKRSSPILMGFNPALVVDRAGTSNEVDINAAPFFVQFTMNKYYDLRFSTKAMYHFGEDNRWADMGAEVAFPIYLKPKRSAYMLSKGIYLAPFISAFNNKYKHFQIGNAGIEPGYSFLFRNKITLSTGIQIGASYVNYELQENKVQSHFKVKLCFGFWM